MTSIIDDLSALLVNTVSYRTRKRVKNGLFYAFLGTWILVLAFPLLWILLSSITTSSFHSGRSLQFIPGADQLTVSNWSIIFSQDVLQMFFNTVTIAFGVMGLTIIVASVAGYGLTRFTFPFKITFARIILFGYMFSPIALAVPMFIIFRELGLLNSYIGAILAISTITIPFSVWLMWQMFQTVPVAKEEAAWIQGASRRRTFREIALPAVKSGIFAIAIFAFGMVWMNFTFAYLLLPDQYAVTLAPGLVQIAEDAGAIDPGSMMAIMVVVTAIPVVIAYLMYDYLLQGFQLR